MSDFSFIHNVLANLWVINAPKRSKRPDAFSHTSHACPFCPGREKEEPSIYRVGGTNDDPNWEVRVLNNKYPFAPIHEVIIHSPDHHKNFDELPLSQVEKTLFVYRARYNVHRKSGSVVIFTNAGEGSGESLTHPHSQLVVTPKNVDLQVPPLPLVDKNIKETQNFLIFCPPTSQWPDEVWIAPQKSGTDFGEITDSELSDLAYALQRLIEIFDIRHGNEFPFNMYISPWKNWYLRIIPRVKKLGGFELATNVYVNTQDPQETMEFILEHFDSPNREKILLKHQAEYKKGV